MGNKCFELEQKNGIRVRKFRKEMCDFRARRVCVDQVILLRRGAEKVRKSVQAVCDILDLEKVYDHVDRKGLRKVLQMYGLCGKLLNSIKSLRE